MPINHDLSLVNVRTEPGYYWAALESRMLLGLAYQFPRTRFRVK